MKPFCIDELLGFENKVNDLARAILDGILENPHLDPRVIVAAMCQATTMSIAHLEMSDADKVAVGKEVFMACLKDLENSVKKSEKNHLTH
jgi:hypothetical protein